MSEENPDDVEPVDDERVGFSEEVFGEEFNIGWICKGLRRKDILRLFFEDILMRFLPDLVQSSSPGLEGGCVAPQQRCPSGQKIGVCKKKNEV